MRVNVELLTVFADGPGGGNPCPVVTGADDLTDEQMRGVAQRYGHESAFVLTPGDPAARLRLRYFVPRHEMEMCVHATVAALSLLDEPGALRVQTPLGLVNAEIDADGTVTVEQFRPVFGDPVAAAEELAAAMGCAPEQIGAARSVSVSRAKLMVDVTGLHALQPDPDAVRRVCERLGVTGLYPFMVDEDGRVFARQFPRDSGYAEDPATGLAAAGLACLLAMRENADGRHSYEVRQGQAMGRPSLIRAHATRVGGEVTRVAVSGRAVPWAE
ncbi:MAG TPA: PhzF family phenazine biosynthesis isomerase [Pseudonocardiaceae bacterium]|nr:PhzF family phenazine biosynthesis isomerase [Pseudonocardiaceae bacterium]